MYLLLVSLSVRLVPLLCYHVAERKLVKLVIPGVVEKSVYSAWTKTMQNRKNVCHCEALFAEAISWLFCT